MELSDIFELIGLCALLMLPLGALWQKHHLTFQQHLHRWCFPSRHLKYTGRLNTPPATQGKVHHD